MKPDIAKIAEGLSRPRIDPRKFVDIGIVTASSVTAEGAIYDVITADGQHETVTLAPTYGGPGYGFYAPIQLDDAVLIATPDGSPNAGGRIIGKLWDTGAPPPQDVIDNQDDLVICVQPGRKIRVIVSGGGDAVIEARDGGHVLLGGDDATDPVVRKSDLDAVVNKLNHFIGLYNSHTNPANGTSPPPIGSRETSLTTPACSPIVNSK